MECLLFGIADIKASDLKINVQKRQRQMEVYAKVKVGRTKKRFPADKKGDNNPAWPDSIECIIDDSEVKQEGLMLVIELKCKRPLLRKNRQIGQVAVPVKRLFDEGGPNHTGSVTYNVQNGAQVQGSLKFSYRFEGTTKKLKTNWLRDFNPSMGKRKLTDIENRKSRNADDDSEIKTQKRLSVPDAASTTTDELYVDSARLGGPRMSYDLWPISKQHLLSTTTNTDLKPLPLGPLLLDEENQISAGTSSGGDLFCLEMGFGYLGSKIFLLGGREPEADAESMGYGKNEYSKRVLVYDIASAKLELGPEMISKKANPLGINVKGSLYVLAGSPVLRLPNPVFEVLHPGKTKWGSLDRPPFLNPWSRFFDDPQYNAYVVIGDKIHLSTSTASFTYDIKGDKWGPCTLFSDHSATIVQYRPPYDWMNYPPQTPHKDKDNDVLQSRGGAPFDFFGGAVLYSSNILICLVPSKGVFARLLNDDGKVEKSTLIKGLEFYDQVTFARLVNLEDQNHIGLILSSIDLNPDKGNFKTTISITSFKVSPNPQTILDATDLNTIVLPSSADEFSSSIGCFNYSLITFVCVGSFIGPLCKCTQSKTVSGHCSTSEQG